MSDQIEFHLNHAGAAAILKSPEVAAAVHKAAQKVADAITRQGLVAHSGSSESGPEIVGVVEDQVTDRARSVVLIEHPAATAMQAKFGVMTKAASEAGLEVHE